MSRVLLYEHETDLCPFFFLTSLYVRRKVQKPAYFNIYKLPRPLALCGDVSMVDSEQLP